MEVNFNLTGFRKAYNRGAVILVSNIFCICDIIIKCWYHHTLHSTKKATSHF